MAYKWFGFAQIECLHISSVSILWILNRCAMFKIED